MRNLPVHWYEGLFLRPQHFQAAERYWTEALQTSEHYDHPYRYGLRRFEFSEEAIGNYQFQVLACEARMRDGTLLSLDAGQQLDRLDLRAASRMRFGAHASCTCRTRVLLVIGSFPS